MGKRIKSTGISVDHDDFTLEGLQKAVGGYIECVSLKNGQMLVVDEEGLLKMKPINLKASRLAGLPIFGDAVLMTSEETKEWMKEVEWDGDDT